MNSCPTFDLDMKLFDEKLDIQNQGLKFTADDEQVSTLNM